MKKMILVTGAHRSGTTWTGQIIASAKNVWYIYEPFNVGIKHRNSPFEYWFECLNNCSKSKENIVKKYLKSFYSKFHIDIIKRALKIRSLIDAKDFLKDIKKDTNRVLIKDPIAIMSSEWLYQQYNCNVVITIRHPAAFIASIKVKDWQFDFNNYLAQEELITTYLKDYKDVIKEYAETKQDIIKQGILLWNTIYSTVQYYKEKYNDEWYFITHEDLSIDPINEFEKIFKYLNLNLDENIKNLIIESTTSKESSEHKRDSKNNIKTWKNRLSKDEIDYIKKETEHVWTKFYSEDDWN